MYEIKIMTDADLTSPDFVYSLLNSWYNINNQQLRPEKYDLGEPVRKPFDENIQAIADLWIDNKLPLMIKRSTAPKYSVDISGFGIEPTHKNRFPSQCIVLLHPKAGDNLAIELFKFLIINFHAGFGLLSTEQDLINKHFFKIKMENGSILQTYEGYKVGSKLPGLYWLTYFGEWAVTKIGISKLNSLTDIESIHINDGLLLKLYDNSCKVNTIEAVEFESKLKQYLGDELFFKKSDIDYKKLIKL